MVTQTEQTEQRTFQEWVFACTTLGDDWEDGDDWEELQLYLNDEEEGEVKWVDGKLMVMDFVVYDPTLHGDASVHNVATDFLATLTSDFAKAELREHFLMNGVVVF